MLPRIPPTIPPNPTARDPIAAPTDPSSPAPIALNAALPGSSPKATESPKSINAPIIGSLFNRGLTNPRTVFAPPFPRTPTKPFLARLVIPAR